MSETPAYYHTQPKICGGCENYVIDGSVLQQSGDPVRRRCYVGATPYSTGCTLTPAQTDHRPMSESQKAIVAECDAIRSMLLEKNRKYGDSALNPTRVFSRADAIEQINVRLDDKLSRIMNRQHDEDEDVDLDLIGYLILRRIAKRLVG